MSVPEFPLTDSTSKASNKPIALSWLFFSDARTQREYDESHIITARRIEQVRGLPFV